jgi:integrase
MNKTTKDTSTWEPIGPILFDLLKDILVAYPINTQRALASDFRAFEKCCADPSAHLDGKPCSPFPATAEAIKDFIYARSPPRVRNPNGTVELDLNATGPNVRAASTVLRGVSSLKTLHRLAGEDVAQFGHPEVHAAVRSIQRGRSKHKQKRPFRLADLRQLFALPISSLWDARDCAIAALAFCAMMRRSEVVGLRVDSLEFDPRDGSGTVTIDRSKGDQSGQGDIKHLPPVVVEAVQRWLAMSSLKDGPLFRRIMADGRLATTALAGQEIARIFRRCAIRIGLSPADISGHSPRIGAAQDLQVDGASLPAIMASGRWSSPNMPNLYTRNLDAKESAMARMMKRKSG